MADREPLMLGDMHCDELPAAGSQRLQHLLLGSEVIRSISFLSTIHAPRRSSSRAARSANARPANPAAPRIFSPA